MDLFRLLGVSALAGLVVVDGCARPAAGAAPPPGATPPRLAPAVAPIRSSSRVPSTGTLVTAPPMSVGMDRSLSARLDSVMAAAPTDGLAPGGVLAVGRHGRLVHMKSYGFTDYGPAGTPTSTSTIYDVASLTKVVV